MSHDAFFATLILMGWDFKWQGLTTTIEHGNFEIEMLTFDNGKTPTLYRLTESNYAVRLGHSLRSGYKRERWMADDLMRVINEFNEGTSDILIYAHINGLDKT